MKQNNRKLYELTHEVINIIFEYTTSEIDPFNDKPYMHDLRKNIKPNPFYNQTADGLYLEFYYGAPVALWTPWGKLKFASSGCGCWESIIPGLLQRFDAKMYEELKKNRMGEFGPIYALHKVDDMTLPSPLQLKKEEYRSYEDIEAEWQVLTKEHDTH
jgi:hypothetical protein